MRAIKELKSFIHDGTLKDLVAVHLQALSLVDNDDEFISISVGEPDANGVRPLTCKLIKHKEVELIVHS